MCPQVLDDRPPTELRIPMTQSRRRVAGGLLALVLTAAAGLLAAPARAAGPNLAPGKSVAASGSLGGFGAGLVNDQNANSYWESPNNAFPQWVQIDLGVATAIDQVTLKLPPSSAWGARTQTIAVQGSTNGTSFTTLSASAG